ncbi:putative fungal zn binuclear cluster domain containing protein [Daldinia childiae]|uniref:putative fungal zn binuclear cluster domain containing protein n=1 Tax=Daldinia childiae TaxID=326645 RepID=UPI00144770E0|nr:putative fungal zn binuclear cluster domain containing protein [Daldinia childiae]KAF3064310.1 putative fungal zn binuclear cluster domain containing protein [Daldinia childiae]
MPFSRTRTGCYTCREDGYKCDEQKPFCGRCIRLQKTCKGYGVRLKWQPLQGLSKSKRARNTRQQKEYSNDETTPTLSTTRYRLVAVSALRQTIQNEDPELSLATILMLQVSDRLFTVDSGVDHLSGAKAIINQAGINKWNSSRASFLLSLCSYHDILASVSRGKSPVFEFDGEFPIEGMESMKELTSVLRIVGQISRMRDQDAKHLDAWGYAIEEILNELDQSEGTMGDVEHTVQAYRYAAYIYLYRVWHNKGAPDPSALKYARSCLAHLSLVAVGSPLVSAQVWPLWTAGCESIDVDQRQFVLDRIDAMYEARHLPSLRRIKQDIVDVWNIKDEQRNLIGVDNVDCIKAILRSRQREADLT